MPNYVKLAATAKRLIEAAGRTCTLRKSNLAVVDPGKPWRAPASPPTAPDGGAVITVKVAFVPPEGSGFGFERVVDGELADTYDQVGLVAADSLPAGTNLEVFSTVEDRGRAWRILRVGRLQPGDVPLVFMLGLAS